MHEMEEGMRSSEGLVKRKNSSGCLIMKKKVVSSGKVFESNKDRKRPRLPPTPSDSSGPSDDDDDNDDGDDSEELSERKKTESFRNGLGVESERKGRLDVFDFDDEDYGHPRFKHTSRKWNDGEIEAGSSRHIMIEKRKKSYFDSGSDSLSGGRKRGLDYGFKRSRLETDDEEAHLPISSFRQKVRVPSDEPIRLQGKNGVLKVMVNKKKKMDVPSKLSDRQLVVGDRKGSKPEIVIEKDMSIGPSYYSDSKRPEKVVPVIRKERIEVKGRKPVSKSAKGGDSETEDSDTLLRRGPSRIQASKELRRTDGKTPSAEKMKPVKGKGVSKSAKGRDSETEDSDMLLRQGSPSVQASKRIRRTGREKMKTGKGKEVSKSGKGVDSETEDSDTSLRRGSPSVPASKGVRKRTAGKAPSAGKRKPVKGKEVQIKRGSGSGTEKQVLREKIRHMLITAGWTIDYRPRRNRDYLDAVYIDPSGTGYWSIVKAYDALQKQQDVEDADVKQSGDSSQFMPLPDNLLSKLTRQTRKKREREMKMKQKNLGRTRRGKERKEGSPKGTEHNGKSLKGRSDETSNGSGDDSGGNLSPKRERSGKQSTATNSPTIQGRKSRKIGRCTLLIRSSDKRADSENDGYVPYTGKRTVLSWLIDSGVVQLSERVQYMNRRRTKAMLEGWVTRDGIHCGCCSKILTVSKFEIHAGSKLRQPFQNICLESGTSLSQCQIEAWNRQEESKRSGFHTVGTDGDDPDDDTCGLCGDGGDLICCDGCPSTFHQSCLDIQMLPPGDWHCPNCICKICGNAGEVSDVGDTATIDALLTCALCGKKYHESCSEMEPDEANRVSISFCGNKCQELLNSLQKLLGVKHELEGGFSWSLIHRMEIDADASHRGVPQRVECNSKLAVAHSVMNECFLPIVDRRSGINLIHNILYNCGSNFSRLNYSGFYTSILERGDEIVAAASIRIHGTQLAEMPFIGTRHMYRRQGMCRRLLSAIELVLCSLKVKKLFIPAIAEHMNTWTMVFGFNPIEDLHKQELRSMNMLVFPGTDMLQKTLVYQKTTGKNTAASSDAKATLIKEDLRLEPELTKESDADSSLGHDLNIHDDDVTMQNGDEIDDEAAAVDSGLEGPAVLSDGNTLLTSSADASCEPKVEVLIEEKATLQSQSVEMSTESSADFVKGPLSSDLHDNLLKMKKPALDPSVNSISSVTLGDVLKSNVKVEHPLEEISARDTAEEIKADEKLLSISTVDETDENKKESNSDLSPCISDLEYKLHVASESEDRVEKPVDGNIESLVKGYKDDNHDAKVKVLDSLDGISAEEDKNDGIPGLVSVSSCNGNDECSVQLVSDMNQPDALRLPGKLIAASLVLNVEVASETEVAIVEGNGQSAAASDIFDTVALDSLDGGSNTTEEVNNKPHHVPLSNLCEEEETIKQCNSGLNHQSKCEDESEIPVASEVCCEADTAPVRNDIQSSEVGDIDDKVDDGKVACVEPDLDSCGKMYAQENDITKDPQPASVSSLDLSTECSVHLDLASNKQNALDMEINLHAASEVALGGCNILSSAEECTGKEAEEGNINAPVESSVVNSTEEIKAHVTVSTIHESDGSSVQFESDQNNHSANAMETDLS